jgi:hypothetical protein
MAAREKKFFKTLTHLRGKLLFFFSSLWCVKHKRNLIDVAWLRVESKLKLMDGKYRKHKVGRR